MCGRFTLRTPMRVLVERFQLDNSLPLAPRFNIAPTQEVAAVRQVTPEAPRKLVLLHWGLIPSWAGDPSGSTRMINARAETVGEKPAFRSAFQRRRCLILADGYYEWKKVAGSKQPFFFHLRDDAPFAFAGLWEQWRGGSGHAAGQPLESCTIITGEAGKLCRAIHPRMPVMLDDEALDPWLDPASDNRHQLLALLQPHERSDLRYEPVSTRVNNPRNDDPQCLEVQRELF